jgi:hypothetical protein
MIDRPNKVRLTGYLNRLAVRMPFLDGIMDTAVRFLVLKRGCRSIRLQIALYSDQVALRLVPQRSLAFEQQVEDW